MHQQPLIPNLFRTEFTKITAVLCKLFGIAQLQVAEDIASDTFLAALETWPYRGVPENPVAWLYAVAKNKAASHIARSKAFTVKVAPGLQKAMQRDDGIHIDLTEKNITDSQLQMLFAVCHPAIPTEAQVGLALRVLCGFGIDEIATAFLTNKETINKRLFRAKEKLRDEKVDIEFPREAEIPKRIGGVLITLYLLYSEGYYSESHDEVLREDLCLEAMRLTYLLLGNETTNLPAVNALLALMCFQSSRFKARKTNPSGLVFYDDQNETLWDATLVEKGARYLRKASQGNALTKYHIEANIAYWYTVKADTPDKWENILQLHNHLLQVEYSPIAALNRTYALAKANSKHAAIIEAEKLQLNTNAFYYALLGYLYTGIDTAKAKMGFENAIALAKTQADKLALRQKLEGL